MKQPKAVFRGMIVLYFIIGLEILIMISPAAGFFYAAFNPFLLSLAQSPATRWLTAFFLPHMVSPPDPFLKTVRVAGSILFVVGALVFFICAGQVYYRKFARKGVALGGLYSRIRHPQYLGLMLTGIGLSILWPRFLVAVLWTAMVVLYYLLARDEERRMLEQFGEEYRRYMERTGMFLPEGMETALGNLLPFRNSTARAALALLVIAVGTIGSSFILRSYTVSRLPLWTNRGVTALAILPDDLAMLDHRMASVLEIPKIKARLRMQAGPFLAYVMPTDYTMQGMIADTGGEWRLYKRHRTFAMIGDWILHPFRHLEGGHAAMRHGAADGMNGHGDGNGMVRRMIFLRAETHIGQPDRADLFGINARRSPVFVADVDLQNLVLQNMRDLPSETGWDRVPTPIF